MFGIEDDSVFAAFEEQELLNPSARKLVDGDRAIYVSRELQMPKKWGAPVLCDFGSAVPGDTEHSEDVQPDIWDLFEGGHLFMGHDQEHQTYRSRAHLAEIAALLGQPPQALLQLGKSSHKFFTGELRPDIPLPDAVSLEQREPSLEGESKERFLVMMRKMLQWEPSNRASAKELADDEWIMAYM
ncbi:hypothetical protein OQA88_1825 [Cercophora sp. LCS_1]